MMQYQNYNFKIGSASHQRHTDFKKRTSVIERRYNTEYIKRSFGIIERVHRKFSTPTLPIWLYTIYIKLCSHRGGR